MCYNINTLYKNNSVRTIMALFEVQLESGLTLLYDSVKTQLTYDGQVLSFEHLSHTILAREENPKQPFDFTNEVYQFPKKDKKIRNLKLQLGVNCNFKCKYCIQASGDNYTSKAVSFDDAVKLINSLKSTLDLSCLKKIELWGGEPFVYWPLLEQLIPYLRKEFADCKIWTISNGSLLSKLKIDLLVDNRIELALSHDGTAQHLRSEDPLKEQHELWLYAQRTYQQNNLRFYINTVLSQYNVDLYALDKYFADKLGSSVEYNYEDVVLAHSKNAVEFTKFTKQQEQRLVSSLEQAITTQSDASSRICNAIQSRLIDVIRRLVYRVPIDALPNRCNAADSDTLSVSMTGDVLSCHNVLPSQWSMGSIYDYDNVKVDKFKHWSLRNNCPSCPYILACKGSCIRNSDVLHYASCKSKSILGKALLHCALLSILGTKVIFIKEKHHEV